ncbi:MAG: SRPBCC family protein [Planctomycetota bacterium]|jgi:uncharacterized membrane protein
MPEFSKTLTIEAGQDTVWNAITNFGSYPQFIQELKEAEVEVEGEEEVTVQFTLVLPIRKVTYRLKYALTAPTRLAWEMVDSNTLTKNSGEWGLAGGGDSTSVTYRHEIGFPAWMAWAVSDSDFEKEMEKTLQKFKAHIEGKS